jgi:hypothetical protein
MSGNHHRASRRSHRQQQAACAIKRRVDALSRKPKLSNIKRVEVQLTTVIIECAEGKEDAA